MRVILFTVLILGAFANQALFGGGQQQCLFKCPSGQKAVPNPKHVPSSNGCGAQGMKIDVSSYPRLELCCDTHDYCYDTCGRKRDDCDNDFTKCLQKTCGKDVNCGNQASLLSMGAEMFGCGAFKAAQRTACLCKSAKKEATRDEI